MPTFTQTGTGKYDYWLLDGGKTFSTIPADTLPSISTDMPIRLQIGDGYFGVSLEIGNFCTLRGLRANRTLRA